MNGRWAMAAVAGILFTDAFGLGNWWEAGAKEYALPSTTLVGIEVVVMGILEAKRIQGWKKTGEVSFMSKSHPQTLVKLQSTLQHVVAVAAGDPRSDTFMCYCFPDRLPGLFPFRPHGHEVR